MSPTSPREEARSQSGPAADLVLRGGSVATVDSAFTVAETVAVKDGQVVAVGTSADIDGLVTSSTRVVELNGRCVLPGQVDSYAHFITSGLDLVGERGRVNITAERSVAGILAAIRQRVALTQPEAWIVTSCMYRGRLDEGRWPTKRDLDLVAPHNPVCLLQGGRPVIVNSYALRLAGIDRDTPDPWNGKVGRDAVTGELTGQLVGGAADLARTNWARSEGCRPEEWDFSGSPDDVLLEALNAQQALQHQCGITAVRDVETIPLEVSIFLRARRLGSLKTRTSLVLYLPERYLDADRESTILESYFEPWALGDDLLKVAGIAFSYSLDGWKLVDEARFARLIRASNRRGWWLGLTPGIGGEVELDTTLAALAEADADRALLGRRVAIMHPMAIRQQHQLDCVRQHGLVLNPNPLLNYHAAARSVEMFQEIRRSGLLQNHSTDGRSQAAAMWGIPARSWVDAGIVVSAGSNTPAAVHDVDHPFLGQYCLLTGDTAAGRLLADQQLTREQMIRAYTCNGAYALGMEAVTGTIEPGKYADFVILDRNIMTCDDREVADLRVSSTYFQGECVHDAG